MEKLELTGVPREEYPVVLRLFRRTIDSRVLKLKEELLEAARELRKFEDKYHIKLADFEGRYLNEHNGNEEHDDAIDWRYWQEVYQRTLELLKIQRR